MSDEHDYTDTERALMLIKEQIAADSERMQREVNDAYNELLETVQGKGDAGILALALLCAEIDHGVANV